MRFSIELPDELFHAALTTAPRTTVMVSKPDEAISGGAAPGPATHLTAEVGQTRGGGVSAGPAEQHLTAAGPGAAAQEIRDGGAAPGSVAD
jgi:hypothetical protein